MKWSTPLPTASIGTRAIADQFTPSLDELKTMSLAGHPGSNVQSSQATNTLPAPSISAEGRGDVRRSPATRWKLMVAIVTALVRVAPPSVDPKAAILARPSIDSNGTTTLPFGCTTGWPPSPWACRGVEIGTLHVAPPSLDVLRSSRSNTAKLSNSA